VPRTPETLIAMLPNKPTHAPSGVQERRASPKRRKLKLFRKVSPFDRPSLIGRILAPTRTRFKDPRRAVHVHLQLRPIPVGLHHEHVPETPARMRDEVKAIDGSAGKSDEAIRGCLRSEIRWPSFLSAPTTSGINLAAWIMPFAVLATGSAGRGIYRFANGAIIKLPLPSLRARST